MCGGQCFLKKNLKLTDESPTEEKVPSSRLKIEIPSFVLSDHAVSLNVAIITSQRHSTPYLFVEVHGVFPSVFHPPSLS
jgi:hypothetical protein